MHAISSCNVNHKRIIKRVADWLLINQDKMGGWPSYFDHMFYKGRTEILKAGWYSAMAQGLAISFLVRAYDLFRNDDYILAAEKAIYLYKIPVSEGGVLSYLNSMPIYEEYPTTPGSYVLNGFIFSLFGLYDLKVYMENGDASDLYNKGMSTLENILPLYDMGNRSAYDLTHITAKTYPNIARWAYHATHVHQLKALTFISDSEIIKKFHERWYRYAFGFRVKPN